MLFLKLDNGHWYLNNMMDMSSSYFSIASDSCPSEVLYQDGDKNYYFKVDLKSMPVKLFMDRYFSGAVSGLFYTLSEAERVTIAPQLIKKLEQGGHSVEVITS